MDDQYRTWIRDIPDFPKQGILFRDITPLLGNGSVYREAIRTLADKVEEWKPELVVGPEARGYVVGAPLAVTLGLGFVPVRKPGKLPYKTVSVEYALEYGTDRLEIHEDAVRPGQRVVLADDLLATGGTMRATMDLVEKLGGVVVGAAFLIELKQLGGRDRLGDIPVYTLVQFDD
ncbi:adenine phosphoribosyltransferase [Alicyclobacillus mali]|uniref:Adenine phosphoribosyltransferase n=1 Tax=Alicyclobacillus mali (ex Roth et al. 2021) TaxID=1123961 RepID=A0ABS0F6B6_9BACL|nr:adenine phosphoribosyltransferase [Alicyclobacillus mali (ex Roth et al. 2021)]MBF8378844.1 adenine phosphoribosyltransferase [Alicyclobacillus mali (ex Roth et al. 2021)]MCL6487978.1 adenine phosphoribosyltransferase [Alicyclobacillus mali (ex Roth et al. 2021)]